MTASGPTLLRFYPAEKARGGEIILRTRMQRIIFTSGLVGAVLLAIIFQFLGWRAG